MDLAAHSERGSSWERLPVSNVTAQLMALEQMSGFTGRGSERVRPSRWRRGLGRVALLRFLWRDR